MATFSAHTVGIMRGAATGAVHAARFDVPLGERPQLPTDLTRRLRAEAQAAGYAAGWAEGRRAAEDEARAARERFAAEARAAAAVQQVAAAEILHTVAAAVDAFERRAAPSIAGMEADLIAAAFALAETIIGRELATASEPGGDALRRALAFAPPGRAALVRLNPADAATLPSTLTADGRDLVLIADATLALGEAVVECDATTVEARIGAALDRAREVLA
jgi:flagellar assembly protein FliH